MYYIDNYRQQAVKKVIPYLINFPQIINILEISADRYQAIENVLWNIANNFWVDDSRGVFLNAHANNEVVSIIYTDKAEDAFTYGTDKPLYQAYGTGHYYSQASYISGIKKTISEDKLIRAVKAKIIQNNTNGTIEDFIESLKLYYNANNVKVYESYPLNVSVMLIGNKLELSSSGNYEAIKKMLPVCVGLKYIYIDPHSFETFLYSDNSSYGDSRYPVLLGASTDIYNYISFSVNLDSKFEEYVKTKYELFEEGMFNCTVCEITDLNDGATILSSTSTDTNISIQIIEENGIKYLGAKYNDVTYLSNTQVLNGERYTIISYNSGTEFKIWFNKNVQIHGQYLDEDLAYISNRILNSTPDIIIDNFNTINAPIYINCINDGTQSSNFGDFTYYAIVFGKINESTIECNEYYASCYGEKQILFNCLKNENHLDIITNNPLSSNILIKQSYYNYKKNHSNGRYMYLDGKSGIEYRLNSASTTARIDNLDINFDICMPVELQDGVIISNICNTDTDNSCIKITKEGALSVTLTYLKTIINEDGTKENINEETTYYTSEGVVLASEYASFKISVNNGFVNIYKNNMNVMSYNTVGDIIGLSSDIKIGFNNDFSSFYKGIIKNLIYDIKYTENEIEQEIILDLPYKNKLEDYTKSYEYVNYGARFITTPQLISDKTGLDLYNNPLVSKRS